MFAFLSHLTETLARIEAEGLTKRERLITSPQGAHIDVGGRRVINLCANNYLGRKRGAARSPIPPR